MQPWTTEYGTLWALETGNGLPPLCQARVEVAFEEVETLADIDDLALAMNLSNAAPIRQRLQGNGRLPGKRRCFCLRAGGRIAAYGWMTRGAECVGELERRFNLYDDEAYIWDCATVSAWRGQRLYSALLSHIIYRLHDEGVREGPPLPLSRIWIGASRQNRPSIQGFINAGFEPVVDVTYRRFYRLTLLWIHQAASTQRPLVAAAYRILVNAHERRWGQVAVGYISNQ
jgi:GNAT superfamily N-acetyltransferase